MGGVLGMKWQENVKDTHWTAIGYYDRQYEVALIGGVYRAARWVKSGEMSTVFGRLPNPNEAMKLCEADND